MNVLQKFGQEVKKQRKIKKISQEKLGELSSLHRTYIGMLERGERNPSLKNISKIAKALGISISDLFKDF